MWTAEADGEMAAAATLPLIVAVSGALIDVSVAATVAVTCSHIGDAHAKEACIEVLYPALQRPRS